MKEVKFYVGEISSHYLWGVEAHFLTRIDFILIADLYMVEYIDKLLRDANREFIRSDTKMAFVHVNLLET